MEDFNSNLNKAENIKINVKPEKYNKIVFCGIGGSAISGQIVSDLINIPSKTAREKLPKWADSKTLCFITSYSGNTKETISLYNQAKKKRCKIIIITSGGKLWQKKENKILIPQGYLPRQALPFLLIPVLKILKIDYKTPKKISDKKAKNIAKKLKNNLPVIYSSQENLKSLAYRWQTQFNENSKTLSHHNFFPEILHNEIESDFKKSRIIILINKNSDKLRQVEKLIKPIKIKLKGSSLIEKILYGISFGDKVSYYLSKIKKVDYKTTKKIKQLKK